MHADPDPRRALGRPGPGSGRVRLGVLVVLLLSLCLAWVGAAADRSGVALDQADILGLRIGMTAPVAEAVVAGMAGVTDRSELGGGAGQTRRVFINFDDDRALFLNFNSQQRGGLLAEVKLTLQGRSQRAGVGLEMAKTYGQPRQTVLRGADGVHIFVWGGTTQGEDSVTPVRGGTTTLRVDESAGSTTITLTGHR